jgi:bifunctional non-homologous end joining protein LigD
VQLDHEQELFESLPVTPGKGTPVAVASPWRAQALALPGARDKPLAAGFAPELVTLVKKPPAGDDWLCETKWDGYRLLADLDHGRAHLRSCNNVD